MLLHAVFDRFVEKRPVAMMTRALLENALDPEALDGLFGEHCVRQYERKLLFSSLVDLMGLVVCRVQPSVNTAFKAVKDSLPVSLQSVYNKLNGIEPEVTAAMIRHVASRLEPVVREMGGQFPPRFPGYRIRIIDGNHLAATDRRLAVLRDSKAAPLPGHSLVVLDPELGMAIDMIPCEDGHAQERTLFGEVLSRIEPKDVWIGDRNFCTAAFLRGVVQRKGKFIIRQHGRLTVAAAGPLRSCGRCSTGAVFEQAITIADDDGKLIKLRRIEVHPDQPTRDGETTIAILTNLSRGCATAAMIADTYRQRWSIEGLFHTLTHILSGEIPSLGYPPAALFAFGVALVSYNIAATLRAALRAKFGHEHVEENISWYYIANEIRNVSDGMEVALEDTVWKRFHGLSPQALGRTLLEYAGKVQLDKFTRTKRGPKTPPSKRAERGAGSHVSTAQLLVRAGYR